MGRPLFALRQLDWLRPYKSCDVLAAKEELDKAHALAQPARKVDYGSVVLRKGLSFCHAIARNFHGADRSFAFG